MREEHLALVEEVVDDVVGVAVGLQLVDALQVLDALSGLVFESFVSLLIVDESKDEDESKEVQLVPTRGGARARLACCSCRCAEIIADGVLLSAEGRELAAAMS